MSLQSNPIYHWLGTNLESTLMYADMFGLINTLKATWLCSAYKAAE